MNVKRRITERNQGALDVWFMDASEVPDKRNILKLHFSENRVL